MRCTNQPFGDGPKKCSPGCRRKRKDPHGAQELFDAAYQRALQRIGALFEDDKILAPGNFSHQWCEF